MYPVTALLFFEPKTAKEYLHTLLSVYPYDISPELVYTLLDENPYPHPSLITFLDYMRHTSKYLMISAKPTELFQEPLLTDMCRLAQHNSSLLHTYQFRYDALLHTIQLPLFHPYAHLSFDKIRLVDELHILQNTSLYFPGAASSPITFQDVFPFTGITFDPNAYLALSIRITTYHGLIFLPMHQAPLLLALSSLYPLCPPVAQPDFILCYGIRTPEDHNIIAYDHAHQLYLGCSMKTTDASCSLSECNQMIRSLYSAITLKKQDLTLPGAFIKISTQQQDYGILLCSRHAAAVSALRDALSQQLKACHKSVLNVFENYGTLHMMDETLYVSGAQIGAMLPVEALSHNRLMELLTSAIPVKEAEDRNYLLTPFTTYDTSCAFHQVHMILYLDDSQYGSPSLFNAYEDIWQDLVSLESAFHKEKMTLWENCTNTILLNNLTFYHIPVKGELSHPKSAWTSVSIFLLEKLDALQEEALQKQRKNDIL